MFDTKKGMTHRFRKQVDYYNSDQNKGNAKNSIKIKNLVM